MYHERDSLTSGNKIALDASQYRLLILINYIEKQDLIVLYIDFSIIIDVRQVFWDRY